MLTTAIVDAVVAKALPRPKEQADLLVRWVAENAPGPGETVFVESTKHGAIIGSKSDQGFELVLDHLFESGLVVGHPMKMIGASGRADLALSFDGWDRYEVLKQGSHSYGRAFMAMKFGDDVLDGVVNEVFRPGAKRAGFDLVKLNDYPRAGLIDNRLRAEIQAADFLVADLTHDNLGAYWEAGYAEGLGKPVIYTCQRAKFESSRTHFDTNHHHTVLWDQASLDAAGRDLTATIRATLPHVARMVDEPSE